MTEFQDNELTIKGFRTRIVTAMFFVFFCFCLLAIRFAYLQIFHFGRYTLQADENRISLVPIVPNRGIIMDRDGVILARNCHSYMLEIAPSKIDRPIEKLIDELAEVVKINAKDRRRFRKLQEESKCSENLPVRFHLTDEEIARFNVQKYHFQGVNIRTYSLREYPLGTTAAHAIGYVGRISQRDQKRINEISRRNENSEFYDPRLDISNYRGTNYIGKIGLEQSYEMELHGITGFQQIEVTAGGRSIRTLSLIPPISGMNLKLSIDIGLQKNAEQFFKGKRGALVAIEPKTGSVLAFVSSPSFDPNLFINGIDQQSWDELNDSKDHPLLNRPLHGTYPPGSTYKPFMALGALTLKKRTQEWSFHDPGFYVLDGHKFRNDVAKGHGIVDMYRSIVLSNDTYYYMLAHDMGVDAIHDFMKTFGFGERTGIDINGEDTGILPSTIWKRNTYHRAEQKRWYEGETISLGIGQGYNAFTILQLAHATATLANNGISMKPYLVKEIIDPITGNSHLKLPKVMGKIASKNNDIEFIKHAMIGVLKEGTAAKVFSGAPYQAAGKTGTAQVFTIGKNEKYHAYLVPERMRDHALFIAFAPADNPKIAVALIVENGGWGAATAGPIARNILDYYLIEREKN